VLGRQIGEMDQQLHALLGPMAPQLEQLDSIPGVNEITARDILAEIGLDMRRFGSAERLAAWAGLSPGNNESAGKRRKGRTRRGNRYLRRVLVQCAWATRKTSTPRSRDQVKPHDFFLGGGPSIEADCIAL
jgi:transposase